MKTVGTPFSMLKKENLKFKLLEQLCKNSNLFEVKDRNQFILDSKEIG